MLPGARVRPPSALLLLLLLPLACTPAAGWRLGALDAWGPLPLVRRRALAAPLEEEPEAEGRLPELPGGYLYPVLAWGPNNQIAGLKEALVLGRLLGRTVIVHNIVNHYDDKSEEGGEGGEGQEAGQQPTSMDFDLVFDLPHLARHQSVVTLAERRRGGWGGGLDAVAHFGPKFLQQIKNARALNVSDEGAAYLDFGSFDCTDEQVSRMAEQLLPYRHVAFIVYENIVRDAGHGIKLRVTGEMCHDQYLRVSGQLTKSELLVRMAADFREKRLGGGKKPYIAVHIRPYPDKCLFVWRRPEYDLKLAGRMCKNRNLHTVLAAQTRRAMEAHGLRALFVMTIPQLRERVTQLYAAEGLAPVYYDEGDLAEAVGYKSTSLLGMVEEEVAFEADVFIGTSYSSMTGIIMQERFARGRDGTLTFTKTT